MGILKIVWEAINPPTRGADYCYPGAQFYSDFFLKRGTVTRYYNDNEWYFRMDGCPHIFRAQAKPQELKWIQEGNDG